MYEQNLWIMCICIVQTKKLKTIFLIKQYFVTYLAFSASVNIEFFEKVTEV